MRKIVVAVAALALALGTAQADEVSKAARTAQKNLKGPGVYGPSGCGLGSLAFGAEPGGVQILAATTNGTFGTQTFGLSSGTSNCPPLSGPAGAALFIDANKDALAKDVARGSGETIATLSHIAGCPDARAVGATLQRSFGAIFPAPDVPSDRVTASVLSALRAEKALACGAI